MFFAIKPSKSWPGLRSRYLKFGFVSNFLLLSLAHFLEPQIQYQVCTQGFSFLTERSLPSILSQKLISDLFLFIS